MYIIFIYYSMTSTKHLTIYLIKLKLSFQQIILYKYVNINKLPFFTSMRTYIFFTCRKSLLLKKEEMMERINNSELSYNI